MSLTSRTCLQAALLAASLCAAQAGHAQAPQLPPPESTDPVSLGIMQGFPPAADKTVRLANLLRYPNSRWGFHHMRELGPTVGVWRGSAAPSQLQAAARELDTLTFQDDKGATASIADWQRSTYTDGLLVLHQGKVVHERTYAGMGARQPHVVWSMSKSFTGLLATMLIQEGAIDAAAPVSRYLPELKDSAWGDATVQQTLDMTTGVQYREDFADQSSGIFQYLFAAGLLQPPPAYAGARTLTGYLPTVKKEGEHGAGFQYKTVDTEVIGWLLQRVTGKSFAALLSERIWSGIGAEEDAYVWVDGIGSQLTSIGVSATLRDLGRLGEMMRGNGRFNGKQVVPAAAVAEIRKGGDPAKFTAAGMPMRAGYSYHNHWWVSHDADGTYEAKGLNGQHIHINPAAQLVVVKLSSHPVGNTAFTHTLDRRAFAALAAAVRGR